MIDFAGDIAGRARWALAHNDGIPNPAWSTGERLAVALVLGDDAYIAGEGYTRWQALTRLAGDIGVGDPSDPDVGAWLTSVRDALAEAGDG